MIGLGKKGIASRHTNSWNTHGLTSMNRIFKSLVILLCLIICGAGAVFMPLDSARANRETPNAMPVRNHESARRIWLQV
jgi:hypothetical protein